MLYFKKIIVRRFHNGDNDTTKVSVHTRQLNFSLQELQNFVDANDIITDPDYQRNYVYDVKRASKLIESILIGIPIPVIYLAEENEGVYSRRPAKNNVFCEISEKMSLP